MDKAKLDSAIRELNDVLVSVRAVPPYFNTKAYGRETESAKLCGATWG